MKKQFLFLVVFLFSITVSNASHFMGGQITYKWISGNDYAIKMTIYRDCSGVALSSSVSATITSSVGITNNLILNRTSLSDITQLCPGQVSSCSGILSGILGVEEHIFEDTVTLAPLANNGVYRISFTGNARNGAITTFQSSGLNMYLETTLNPNLANKNTSPEWLNIPIINFRAGVLCTLSPNGFDADGDVLKYSLIAARDGAGSNINYVSGLSGVNPLFSSTPITINPTTGLISFTPTTAGQVAVLCVRVEEYRAGVKIGEVVRDIEIKVYNAVNHSPIISQQNSVVVPVGQNFCTTINATDAENDNLNLTATSGIASQSNFTVTAAGAGFANGSFCFTPTNANAGQTYTVSINATDNNCPVVLSSVMTFNIIVPKSCSTGASIVTINPSNCLGTDGSIKAIVSGASQPYSFYWSGVNGFAASTDSIGGLQNGNYCLIVTDGTGCVDNLCTQLVNTLSTSAISDTLNLIGCTTVTYNGIIYNTYKNLTDTIRTTNGCDSVYRFVNITPQNIYPISKVVNIYGCNKINYNGNSYTKDTKLKDVIRSVYGCDSISLDVNLIIIKPVTNFIKLVSCNGKSVDYNKVKYFASTHFIDTLKAVGGCDSIYNDVIIIIFSLKPSIQKLVLLSCNGKLTWNGIDYKSSTILNDTLRTVAGCDSVYRTTSITISNITPTVIAAVFTGCNSVKYNGKIYTSSAIVRDTIRSVTGCDSIINIANITIISIKPSTQSTTLSGCYSVLFDGNKYYTSAILKDTLKNMYGCDSVYRNTTITVTQPVTPSITILNRGSDKTCKGATISIKAFVTNGGANPMYQWTVNGLPIAGANAVYFITNSLNNNDTVRCIISSSLLCITTATSTSNFIIVKVVEPVYKTTTLTGCNKVIYNGVAYTNNTTLNDTARTSIGCDSIINTVNILINSITATILTTTMVGCNSIVYNGTAYIASTTLRDTIKTAQGCDSVYLVKMLNVIKINAVTNIVSTTGCGKVIFREKTYTASIVLNDTLRSVAGCDSVYNITNITVNPTATPTIVITPSQNPVCANSNVIFTATITNGGTNPQYQWYKNGVLITGATSATYNYAGVPDSNTVYTCRLTSNAPCAEPSNVVSNNLRLYYIGTAIASISITANQTTICSTATVIFTATAINGGTAPQYQWKKNGVNISGANNASYSTATIANNDVFTCALVSNSLCVSTTNVLSNGIVITLNANNNVYVYSDGSINVSPFAQLNIPTSVSTTRPAGGTWSAVYGTFTNGNINFYQQNPGANYVTYQSQNQLSKCITSYSTGVYVYTLPTSLTGNTTICTLGATTTINTISTFNGVWTSSNPSVATVTASSSNGGNRTAIITAMGAGTATISFSMGLLGSYYATPVSTTVTVAPVTVAPITGNSSICIGATTQLTNATPSGVWSSIAGRATTNITGLVTGTSAGVAEIRYTVNNVATGCSAYAVKNITVNSLPNVPSIGYAPTTSNPQTGIGGGFCNNRTFDVVGTPIGGIWTSNNNSVMTVTPLGTVATVGLGTATLTYTVSSNGCSNSRSIVGTVATCVPRGVNGVTNEEQETRNEFTMYPNPARSFISLSVKTLIGSGSIIISDLYGKQVKTQSLSMGTNTIDVSSFAKGMYFVSTITSEGKTTKKLIVE